MAAVTILDWERRITSTRKTKDRVGKTENSTTAGQSRVSGEERILVVTGTSRRSEFNAYWKTLNVVVDQQKTIF